MNKEPVLGREEFLDQMNNFPLHFAPGDPDECIAVRVYHQDPAYVGCMKDAPLVFGRVVRALERMIARNRTKTEHYFEMLYRAYRMMHPYAKKDQDLFS